MMIHPRVICDECTGRHRRTDLEDSKLERFDVAGDEKTPRRNGADVLILKLSATGVWVDMGVLKLDDSKTKLFPVPSGKEKF